VSAKARRIRKTIRIGGKRVSQYFSTKALAEKWYRQMLDRKDLARAGVDPEPEDVLLVDVAKVFIAKRLKSHGHNTWVNDEQRMRTYLLPEFKDRPLRLITAAEWKALFESIVTEKGKAKATSNQVRALVSKMYNDAIEAGILKDNPIRRIKPYDLRRGRAKKIKEHFWHDLADLVSYLEASRDEEPGFYVYKFIECNTGLRRSQIVPLKWKDYDPKTRVLNIERSYMASNDTINPGSKGFEEGDDYVVGVNDALQEVLKWWAKRTPYGKPNDFICVQTKNEGSEGNHFFSWHLRKAHERVIKRAGLKRIKPHGIRHTYSTHYLESGGTLEGLQRMLGHKNISTTEIYTHVIPKAMKQKANVMNVRSSVAMAKPLSPQRHQNKKDEEE
jgi:integrase